MATNKQITSLSTLQIHKLSQAQYNEYVKSEEFDDYAIYLTPDEDDFVDRTEYERDISDITGEIDGILDSAEEWNLAYEHATSGGHAPEDAEKNTILTINVNNSPLTPDVNRAVNIEVPDAYTKDEVDDLIADLKDEEIKTNADAIGDLKELDTENQGNLVAAINEVRNAIDAGGVDAAVTVTSGDKEGYVKSYIIKQGENTVGEIDIPKDLFVESGEVVENPVISEDETLEGTYIVLRLIDVDEPLYINAASLVENYTYEDDAEEIQLNIDGRCISATIVEKSITKNKLSKDLVDELYSIVGDAEAAEAAALAAQEAAEAANEQVSASAATALAAQEAAEAAQLAATEAQDSAEASALAASGSQSAAETAQSKAEEAQEAAEEAQSNAEGAKIEAATAAQNAAISAASALGSKEAAAELYDAAIVAKEAAQNALDKIGDISNLETKNKTDFVSALNEVLGLTTNRVAAQIIIWPSDEGTEN